MLAMFELKLIAILAVVQAVKVGFSNICWQQLLWNFLAHIKAKQYVVYMYIHRQMCMCIYIYTYIYNNIYITEYVYIYIIISI